MMGGSRGDGGTVAEERVEGGHPDGDPRRAASADCRAARVLATTEVRAQLRRIRGDVRQLIGVSVLVLMFGVVWPLVGLPGAISLGRRIAAPEPMLGSVGAVLTGVLGGGLYLGVAGGMNESRVGSIGPLVRTSVPPRAVAVGRFVSDSVQTAAVVLPAAVILLGGVAWGGGPLVALALGLGLLPVVLAGFLVGRAAGQTLRYASQRYGISLWTKALVVLVVSAAVVAGVQMAIPSVIGDSGGAFAVSLPPILPGLPLWAYASVVLAPFGTPLHPVGGLWLGGFLGASTVALVAVGRLERVMLVADAGDHTADGASSRSPPAGFDRTPSTRVAWRYLVRTVRDPRMLAHLAPLLFGGLGGVGWVLISPGILLDFGAPAMTILGGVLAGATYGLNPMGDDRDQLPLILTSAPSTAVMLRGRLLAGTALGLAVAVGLGVPFAVASGSLRQLVAPLLFAPPFALASGATALGFGALIPQFERHEYMNVQRSHPSMLALFGFGMGGLLVGVVGLGLTFLALYGVFLPWILGLLVVYALLLSAVAVVMYVYAVRTFDALTMDDV